jgi:hypothetical protein
MVEITLPVILQIVQTVGILVGIVYYLIIMRNSQRNQELTLETRQAQMFMQMQNRFADSMQDIPSVEVIQSIKFDTFEEFLDLYHSDPTINKVMRGYGRFYENLGVLVKEELIEVRLVALMWGGPTRMYWDVLEPILDDWRVAFNYPRLWSETEYICKEVLKYMDEHPELKT